MSNTRPEADIARAKALRTTAKDLKDPDAKRAFEEAAVRVERNAAKKARKIGRRPRTGTSRTALPTR